MSLFDKLPEDLKEAINARRHDGESTEDALLRVLREALKGGKQ